MTKRANGEGSIYPYRNGYAAHVWVAKPNGIRERKYIYGRSREEVHEKFLKLHQRARQGAVVTNVPKLGEFLTYWLDEIVKPNLAPATYVNYELFVRLHIRPALGQKRLDRLTVRDVQTWANRLAEICQCCAQDKDVRRPEGKQRCCAKGKCCEAKLSARTLNDVRACLRAALSQAVTEDLIAKNPAVNIKLPSKRRDARKPQAWSADEARKFLESARADDDPLLAAFVLILVIGLRKGEALGLTWPDLNLDTGELKLGRQLQRVSKELLHRELKTETSDEVVLPLVSLCTASLRHRQQQQTAERDKAGDGWQESAFVFTTKWGTPIEPRNFNRSWDARCAKAGVRKITVHDGRRTCGTLLAELDVHPRVAMAILRHAQVEVTMKIYTLASDERTRAALKRLGESLDQ